MRILSRIFSFGNEDSDDEDYGRLTGNEGASITHLHRRSCIVLLPQEQLANFLPVLVL